MIIQKVIALVVVALINGLPHASTEAPAGLKKLLQAYPGQFKGAASNALIWNDNTQMTFDDGIKY